MKAIYSKNAPAAIGPYCHAMQVGNLIYCSGQTPLDPLSMELVAGGIIEQTKQALNNLETVLKSKGLSRDNIFQVNVYMIDLNQFEAMNNSYASFFGDHNPARTTVEVSRLPKNALIEIECKAEVTDQNQ